MENKGGVRFIRKKGRVIPIRTTAQQYKRQAVSGAVSGGLLNVGLNIVSSKAAKTNPKFGAIGAGLIGVGQGLSLASAMIGAADSLVHARESGSALSGLTRFVGLSAANLGGSFAGVAGSRAAIKGLTKGSKAAAKAVRSKRARVINPEAAVKTKKAKVKPQQGIHVQYLTKLLGPSEG